MADSDALKSFEFPKSKGLFVSFASGDEFKVRVLTTDPVVTNKEFEGADGEINISTKFAFIVYNFTLEKAQILNAGATITREIQRLHQDEEWGANIKKIDIKIKAEGEKLNRKYTITPVPKAETLTNEQIKECQAIDLDEKVEGGQRMSFYNPEEHVAEEVPEEGEEPTKPSTVDDLGGEPINIDDIPF